MGLKGADTLIQIPNDACLNCYETAQRLAEPGSDFCAKCAAELAEMQERNKTAEEKALAELRKAVYDMWFRYRVLSFNASHDQDPSARLLALCQLLDWLGAQLDAARKI